MLAFKADQVSAFKRAARRAFEEDMAAHCRTFSPALCQTLSDDALRAAVRLAIARAEAHGFDRRGPVRLYLDLTLVLGIGFDTDPQYPWAAEVLARDDYVDAMHEAEVLHEASCAYLSAIGGPGCCHARRALRRIATLDLPTREREVRSFLLQVYPEKCAAIGEEPLTRLIAGAFARGRAVHGLTEERSLALMAALAFSFGHAFDRDPFHGWIQRTLEARGAPEALADRLARRAGIWFRAAVSNAPPGGRGDA